MFRRIRPIDKAVEFTFEQRLIRAADGDSVAAALLAAGVTGFRFVPGDGALRGPY